MRRWTGLAVALAWVLGGCSEPPTPIDPATLAPLPPIGHVAGATLPRQVAGYTALGALPATGQLQATYALDRDGAVLAVVTLSFNPALSTTPLREAEWYGQSRCGVLDEIGEAVQNACLTPLIDGLLTVVGTTDQTAEALSVLANAVASTLP